MDLSRPEQLKLIRRLILPADQAGLRLDLLGFGTSGAVFRVVANPKKCVDAIRAHVGGAHSTARCLISDSTGSEITQARQECAVKVQIIGNDYEADWATREAEMHMAMSSDPVVSRHVPALHAAWLMRPIAQTQDASGSVGFALTAMEYLEGYRTAWACVSDNALFQDITRREVLYRNARRMVLAMWSQGFSHGDLHARNIMINPDTLDVRVIDFGFSEVTSARTRESCRRAWLAFEGKQWLMTRLYYRQCSSMVMDEISARLEHLAYHHPDPCLLASMRMWVDDPSCSLVTEQVLRNDLVVSSQDGATKRQRRDASTKDLFYDMQPRVLTWVSALWSRILAGWSCALPRGAA